MPIDWATLGQQSQNYARLVPIGSSLAFESTYHKSMVEMLKLEIPSHARKWDPARKAWLIDPAYAGVCVDLAQNYLGITITAPKVAAATAKVETRLVLLEYLGAAKMRGNESTAFGWADGGWTLIFPEDVLRTWFEAPKTPTQETTLFNVLAIKQDATHDEIKAAHRRLALQWHPDRCHEPDAAEQFKRIQHAYEILSDPLTRKKYVAGLYLQEQAKRAEQSESRYNTGTTVYTPDGEATYRAPYRCGWLLVEGQERLGRFVVSKITQWEDVTDEQGRVMVTSWPAGADKFVVAWV